MKFYIAPLEGITGYLYRRAHFDFFPGADRYYIPFIAPRQTGAFTGRELRDIDPQKNEGIPTVPQILTNNAEAFIHTARLLHSLGYGEVNLNLGCPSATVVTKGKGAGFLAQPQELDRFLDTIYSALDLPVSIKTRIGVRSSEEAEGLIAIYRKYPVSELIVHPRIQTDGYRNHPNREVFAEWVGQRTCPIAYNGDIFTREDYREFARKFPQVEAVMLGRGMITNPALIRELRGGALLQKEELRAFSQRLYSDYRTYFSGERSVLFKLKEMWFYQARLFSHYEKYLHQIQKATTLGECEIAVQALLREQELLPLAGYLPVHGDKMQNLS